MVKLRILHSVASFVFAFVLSGCSILNFHREGSARNPIVLDTMDLPLFIAQDELPERGSERLLVDVLHTELDLSIDYDNERVLGKAKLTLTAHSRILDTIELDARGFVIQSVVWNLPDTSYIPNYTYDGHSLRIVPANQLSTSDTSLLEIVYHAQPSALEKGNGNAIRSSQGLYFVYPEGSKSNRPVQVWTQGETEYNSGWFPCVDQPNEKHTQDVILTVDSSYVTLSNGRLVYSIDNGDGTRTDHWKQELPHSTYLTMIAIGDFTIVKDQWRELDVWYYVDHAYAPYAKAIFGNTPEMLEFYSSILGVKYPWDKYHQVVVKEFVSGAMENTSAVVHGEFLQQTPRQMLDGNHEDVIAHELFHHWFGDLVTAESWTHIAMNEGFATYGEHLWWQYKYGWDEANHKFSKDLAEYLNESMSGKNVPLVRSNYLSPDDVFDRHSYQKGGRIIHMLRKEIGDEAFFAGLKSFLMENAYGSVEETHLRLAMEAVCGCDLKWFFDQWFYTPGHPNVNLNLQFAAEKQQLKVIVDQLESEFGTFRFHLDVAIGNEDTFEIKRVWVDEAVSEIDLKCSFEPSWYLSDPFGDMLWESKETKSIEAWASQLSLANTYSGRLKALTRHDELAAYLGKGYGELLIERVRKAAFWSEKLSLVEALASAASIDTAYVIEELRQQFESATNTALRSEILKTLDILTRNDPAWIDYFTTKISDPSKRVASTLLSIIAERDPCTGANAMETLDSQTQQDMLLWFSRIHAMCGSEASLAFFETKGEDLTGMDRFLFQSDFARYASKVSTDEAYHALVTHLAAVVFNDLTWWEAASVVQGLEQALGYYSKQRELLENSEQTTTEEENRLSRVRNKEASLKALIEEARFIQTQQGE